MNDRNPDPQYSNCTQALCTRQADTFVDINQISSQGVSISFNGYWFNTLFPTFPPPKDSQPFEVQVDGQPLDVFQNSHNFHMHHNIFAIDITRSLSSRDGGHTFRFTNLQSSTSICLLEAYFKPFGRESTTSPSGSGSSTLPTNTSSPSPSASNPPVRSGTSSTAIAVAVVIPILTVLCLLFLTVYLRRRWRHRKGSVPATSERLGLDEPSMAERGSTLKTWSPTQSPFLSEMPIPRQIPRPTRARGEQRHFATFTLSSVSSIPQPPASVNPPSTQSSRSSIFDRAQVTFERLKTVRRTTPDPRRGVLRAVNVSDE